MNTYYDRFKACVYVCLGGLDMAEEFFDMHPRMYASLRLWADYHYHKGGAAYKGAAIWYERVGKPQLKWDRELAQALEG